MGKLWWTFLKAVYWSARSGCLIIDYGKRLLGRFVLEFITELRRYYTYVKHFLCSSIASVIIDFLIASLIMGLTSVAENLLRKELEGAVLMIENSEPFLNRLCSRDYILTLKSYWLLSSQGHNSEKSIFLALIVTNYDVKLLN